MMEFERRIVEEEVARLEAAWERAQGRYELTGSRSTDRTMTRYMVIRDALLWRINDHHLGMLEQDRAKKTRQLERLQHRIRLMTEAGKLTEETARELTEGLSEV